ncbi:MAG: type I 3-dehydroquinate dehydratase [Eubacteriales bacterium]|nr:type I 3-dehydroquinate dehydratase [Eubacteriales bacterium]
MKKMKVKNITLDIGRPKIAVPITGRSHEEIMSQVNTAMETHCDMLEWRADYYFADMPSLEEQVENTTAHMGMIRILDDIDYKTESMPLILKLKGINQGGVLQLERKHAYDLAALAAQSKLIDFVDMELLDDDNSFDAEQVLNQVNEIHKYGVKVIHSYHDFTRMPSLEQILSLASNMRALGADIVKICGTAKSTDDAKLMLEAAGQLTSGNQNPVILIAMGQPGVATRVAGGKYGSCISYAYCEESTAEGQINVNTLTRLMDEYYGQ